MTLDLGEFDARVRSMPLPLLYAVGTGVALLALVILRFISNSLPAKSPPIFEGTPYIGGIMKFIKVGALGLCHLPPGKPRSSMMLDDFRCDIARK